LRNERHSKGINHHRYKKTALYDKWHFWQIQEKHIKNTQFLHTDSHFYEMPNTDYISILEHVSKNFWQMAAIC
jgi:hypothetical protein